MAWLFQVLMGLLVAATFITTIVLWVIAIVQIFKRTDLKNNKWMWLVLFIFTGALGSTIYYFVEGNKKYGTISLVTMLLPIVLIPLYAIVSFTMVNLAQ